MHGDGDLELRPLEFEVSSETGGIFKIGLNVLPYDVPFRVGGILSNLEAADLFDPSLGAVLSRGL